MKNKNNKSKRKSMMMTKKSMDMDEKVPSSGGIGMGLPRYNKKPRKMESKNSMADKIIKKYRLPTDKFSQQVQQNVGTGMFERSHPEHNRTRKQYPTMRGKHVVSQFEHQTDPSMRRLVRDYSNITDEKTLDLRGLYSAKNYQKMPFSKRQNLFHMQSRRSLFDGNFRDMGDLKRYAQLRNSIKPSSTSQIFAFPETRFKSHVVGSAANTHT